MHGYLSTITEVSVMEGTVTADAADQATTISFTLTSGAAASVMAGMEVIILTSGNSLKGRLRVADGGSTSTVLQVNEFSPGRVKVVTGDKLKVMRSFRLRDLLVAQTTFNKDSRIAYSAQNSLIRPIANTGGLYVGGVSGGIVSVPHFGSLSSTLDPDSPSTMTHLWDVKDGTITVGTTTTADITAEYGAGSRVIDYTVTDPANGTSSKKYTLVRTHDDTDVPIPLTGRPRLSGNRRDGYSMTFVAAANCGIDELPDGALVVFWKDERRNTTTASYGSKVTGRSHIKFVGFLIRESIRIDVRLSTVTFEAVCPRQILRLMTGFSQVLEEIESPANWQQYKGLSVKQLVVYLLRWHTTALDIFDLIWNISTNYTYPRFFIQQSTPAAQVQEVLDAISARFAFDRTGRMEVNKLLARSTTAERSAATTTLTLATADIVPPLDVNTEHRYTLAQLEGKGFTTGAQPLKSVAPGEAPAEAAEYAAIERLIVADQDELNRVTGHAFAERNSLYDGQPVPKGMPFKLPPGYDVWDIAYEEWIGLPSITALNDRARAFLSSRGIVDRVEVSYDETTGCDDTTIYVDHETRGEAGVTRAVDVGDTPPDTGGDIPPFTNPDSPISRGTASLAWHSADNATQQTGNFTAPDPDYTEYAYSLTGTLSDFTVDAFSPGYPGGGNVAGGAVNGWIATEQQVRKITDIFGARTLGSAFTYTNPSGAGRAQMNFERGVANWGIVVHTGGYGCNLAFTQNGTSWTEVLLSGFFDSFGDIWHSGIALSPRLAGTAYISDLAATGDSSSGSPPACRLMKTTNYGASWTAVSGSWGSMRMGAICVPYQVYDFGTLFHGFRNATDASDWRLYRSVIGGAHTDISPSFGGDVYGVDNNPHNRCLASCDTDMNTLLAILTNPTANKRGLFLTRNAMASSPTWTAIIEPVAIASFPYVGAYVVDRDLFYLFGTEVALVSDGATVVDKTGDLALGGATVRGLCGAGRSA